MKESLLTLLVFGLSFAIHGQELMTIGEVFNFEVGDKFQIEGNAYSEPPNADRIEIIGKYYSSNEDTLYYIRFHDSYYSEIIWGGNPYLEYHFWIKTDTVFYTSLDSLIVYYDQGFEFNQYIENSTELCDSLINGCAYESGPGFENDCIINEYGKGLGETYDYFYSGQGRVVLWSNSLFYYKKGDFECGTPDTLAVGIEEQNIEEPKIIIYPNPTRAEINIIDKSSSGLLQCSIIDLSGQRVMTFESVENRNRVSLNHLEKGIYFIQLNYKDKTLIKKIIKE